MFRKLRAKGDSHAGIENIAVCNMEKASSINREKFKFREELFSFFVFFFILCSFNYRGSTSDTAESLYSLPGKVGAQGVQDVKKVTDLFLDNCNDKCDREKIYLCGGSHGDICQLVLLDNFQMIL